MQCVWVGCPSNVSRYCQPSHCRVAGRGAEQATTPPIGLQQWPPTNEAQCCSPPHQQGDAIRRPPADAHPAPRQLSKLVHILAAGAPQQLKQLCVLLAQDLCKGASCSRARWVGWCEVWGEVGGESGAVAGKVWRTSQPYPARRQRMQHPTTCN